MQSKLFLVYRWSLSYYKPYFWLLILLVFYGLVVNGVQLSIPKIVQHFIDVVVPDGNFSIFGWIITGLSVAVLVMLGVITLQFTLQRSLQGRKAV